MPSVRFAPLDGGLALLQIDRPPANAIDLALLDELVGAFERIPRDPPRALVIAGRARFFSAGINLKTVPHYGPDEQRRVVSGINRMLLAAYALELPVVAAVTGHAIGGGMLLTLCADYRVASTAGRYGIPGVKVGIPYPQAAIEAATRSRAAATLPLSRKCRKRRLFVLAGSARSQQTPAEGREITDRLLTIESRASS